MGNKRLFHQVKEKEIFKRVGKHTLGIFVITFIGVLEKTFKCYLLKKLYVGNQLTSTVGILQIISQHHNVSISRANQLYSSVFHTGQLFCFTCLLERQLVYHQPLRWKLHSCEALGSQETCSMFEIPTMPWQNVR